MGIHLPGRTDVKLSEWNIFAYFLCGILPGLSCIDRAVQTHSNYWLGAGIGWMIGIGIIVIVYNSERRK